MTGIDRVEIAYLYEVLRLKGARFLVRTTRGYLLLDRSGGKALAAIISGERFPGQADFFSRLTGRGSRMRHRVEAALRPHAVDRCLASRLPAMLDRQLPGSWTYLNVGHSNLSEATLAAMAQHDPADVVVMIHDLIPITHPDLVAEGMPQNFAGRIERVQRHADAVLLNSTATADRLAAHWAGQAAPTRRLVAPLGVTRRSPTGRHKRAPGHFVMLGTIEPRKNHVLMLDVWEALARELPKAEMPVLHIIGAEGWNVAALMQRLHNHPLNGAAIRLHGAVDDDAVQAHLACASALVFPSMAEGYGFPPLEAVLAGATPICADLPVLREMLGKSAIYVKDNDLTCWKETIKQHIQDKSTVSEPVTLSVPTWTEHFDVVADAISADGKKGGE